MDLPMASRKHFSVSEDGLLDLVSQVYDAGLDASRWNQTLQSMTEFFQAEQINLRIIDPDSRKINLYYYYNRDPYWVQVYKDYFYQVDPWMEMLHNSDNPIVSCTNHIFSDREYRQTEIYNDYIIPTDSHFGMGGLVKVNRNFKTYLSMQKSYISGDFHMDQLHVLKKLVPHINKSILISQRTHELEFQRNTLMHALNRINNAAMLLNDKRHVMFMNTAAETMLAQQRKDISVNDQGIQLSNAQQTQRLAALILNATVGTKDSPIAEAGGMLYQPTADHDGLSILVSPLNPSDVDFDIKGNKAALVIISGTSDRALPAQEMLSAIYKLTEAEARVVSLLCADQTLNEICEQLHLTMNTIKTHLKSAFNKTGTRRQVELVNLINTGPTGIVTQS